jgi:hypothetical protein
VIILLVHELLLIELDDGVDDLKINHEKKELDEDKMLPSSSFTPLSSAAVDHQIEVLLSEWSKNADMLFSIHPMDGSLLVWHVDWLDEYQPGMFRQVQVLLIIYEELILFFLCENFFNMFLCNYMF